LACSSACLKWAQMEAEEFVRLRRRRKLS